MVSTPERAAIAKSRSKDSRLSRVFKSLVETGGKHGLSLLPLGASLSALPFRKVGMGVWPLALLSLSFGDTTGTGCHGVADLRS